MYITSNVQAVKLIYYVIITVCIDCVVDWEPWSACGGGIRERSQIVIREQQGAGIECPELQYQVEGNCIKY